MAAFRAQAPTSVAGGDDVPDRLDLRGAVAALPPQQRLVIALHYLLDLPVAEVATALDIAPATVRSHLHAARRALASVLDTPRSPT